jgi:hypothetical protein
MDKDEEAAEIAPEDFFLIWHRPIKGQEAELRGIYDATI